MLKLKKTTKTITNAPTEKIAHDKETDFTCSVVVSNRFTGIFASQIW